MTKQALVAGGGIGGMAAALAMVRQGWSVQLFERAPAFSEVGAGVQLGPNVVKILYDWGLSDALHQVAALPEKLEVLSAVTGERLGGLHLGRTMRERYGAPYLTVHRADLHGLLLEATRQEAQVSLHSGQALAGFAESAQSVSVATAEGSAFNGSLLVGADGLWSSVRQQLLADGPPRRTGHLAYRALLPQSVLPEQQRLGDVRVWLGPSMHVVQYPVRRGEWLNIVAIIHGDIEEDVRSWDHAGTSAGLAVALKGSCAALRNLIAQAPGWGLWALHDRPPMAGAHQHAHGRVALLGDAAHPMLPYLAQGAGMAIEDAAELAWTLRHGAEAAGIPALLAQFAQARWRRNARVQARAARNGRIFHADGLMRWGRDLSMKLLGEKLLDMPWLYGASPKVPGSL